MGRQGNQMFQGDSVNATPLTDEFDKAQTQAMVERHYYDVMRVHARRLERELTRLKRLEAILRERVDTDHNDQPNAEARALMDWEAGE